MEKLDLGAIEKRLTFDQPSKRELQGYIDQLRPLGKAKLVDILIRGIPWPDGIRAEFQIDRGSIADTVAKLAEMKDNRLRGWSVFPRGIPFPDFYRLEVDIGRPGSERMGP